MNRARLALLSSLLLGCEEKAISVDVPRWDVSSETGAVPTLSFFEHDDFRFEVQAPHRCHTKAPFTPGKELARLSFPVSIDGKSKRPVPVSAMVFTLVDEDGHKYRPTLAGCAPPISRRELTAPIQVLGEVAFDVPKTNGRWVLTFHPFLVGRKEVNARVLVPLPTPP